MKTLCLLMFSCCCLPLAAAAGATVQDLRCEYRVNPLGIDACPPRLSWKLAAPARGVKQAAYQVLVASSPDRLSQDQGDLWDSGRVAADQSIHVPYAGKQLTSGQLCHWKVRVWATAAGGEAKPSAWSTPAHWSMGLLTSADWKGQWIGKDETEKVEVISDVDWIWYPEPGPPPGTRLFRRTIRIDPGQKIQAARLLVAADNLSQMFLNGQLLGRANSFRSATEFNLAKRLKPGANALAVSVQNMGEGPNPAGLLAILKIDFAQGAPLVLKSDVAWKAAKQESSGWQNADFDDSKWVAAKRVGPAGMKPWGETRAPEARRLAARWLRKEFSIARPIRRATVYVSGLGLSEVHLNGQKVGDHVLSPGLTEYNKRVFYVAHDVTAQLRRGANALGVALGNGRYYAPRTVAPTATRGFGYPKLLLQLNVECDDGSTFELHSDPTWKLTVDGPIAANNEYDGEEYDARKELSGWSQPGFNDARWPAALAVTAPEGELAAQMAPPIRIIETRKPQAVANPQLGMYVFDMGQNMVGWCRIRVAGPAGTEVSLRFAETIHPDGTLYLDNIRGAKVTDLYTLKGQGVEVWEPRFTYHGFRYVEVRGWPGKPDLNAIEGCVVHDDLPSAGAWSCSNPLLNRIYQNVVWGVRGNYRSMPTDCPQRDERQGWLGDRSAESKGETFLYQNAPLYAKWLQDMADGQKDSGSVSDVCPSYWPLYNDSVTWPASIVLIPGGRRAQFGDEAVVGRAYPSMKKWMDHMCTFMKDDLMDKDSYGDWCVPPEDPQLIHSKDPARKTAKAVLATTYFYHCARQMADYAKLAGKPDDARHFTALAERLCKAFNRRFLAADGAQYDNGSQTSCVLPLAFGMVPPERRAAILNHLTDKIARESKYHVGTGLVGGQWLMRTLTANGHADLAYRVATQKTYPSWGYMIANDATTIWELWNGNTADPAMNSHNHVMLVGDLVIWCYENVAGICSDPGAPGFRHIIMRPTVVGDLTHVEATHHCPYGLIRSAWKRSGNEFQWTVITPPNTTATLYLPAASADEVTEGGKPLAQASGVRLIGQQGDRLVVEVGSGEYRWSVRGFSKP